MCSQYTSSTSRADAGAPSARGAPLDGPCTGALAAPPAALPAALAPSPPSPPPVPPLPPPADRAGLSIEFLGREASAFVPHLAVDCVVLGFHDGALQLLLTRWRSPRRWSLPGGFVRRDESLDDAARRVLRLRTGLDGAYLEQFHAFGAVDRGDPEIARAFDEPGAPAPDGAPAALAAPRWIAERVVSVAYYALVDHARARPAADGVLTDECRWWPVHARPALLFDHDAMVDRALGALRTHLGYRPVARSLLPDAFTLPELQRLYEAVLERSLDRRNFQKKMRELEILDRIGERRGVGVRRAPYLYRFRPAQYDEALRDGISLGR